MAMRFGDVIISVLMSAQKRSQRGTTSVTKGGSKIPIYFSLIEVKFGLLKLNGLHNSDLSEL